MYNVLVCQCVVVVVEYNVLLMTAVQVLHTSDKLQFCTVFLTNVTTHFCLCNLETWGPLVNTYFTVSLTCHSETPVDFLQPLALLAVLRYRRSTSLPSADGLFRFPAPASGRVFHHTWHLHRRWRYSDSVLKHFSFICHIRPGHLICYTALFNCGPCDNFCYLGHTNNTNDDDDDDTVSLPVSFGFLSLV